MKQNIAFKIREAREADIPIIMDLAKQLAVYGKFPDSFVAKAADYSRWGWGSESIFKALLAENIGK